ncbi:MAG: DJ-1/PfpI family protein, partial [Anaerolineae bacterium]|nr:DJ-1/PfpI family protein [Anaerolineae bacterium]
MRNVAILIFDEVEVLDFAGPFEVFGVAGAYRDERHFDVYTVAEREGPIIARNGLSVNPAYTLASFPPPDILVIPGGRGVRREIENPAILGWIREQNARTELTLSVCTGAWLLGQIGALDGLRATTHWRSLDRLREIAPLATVQENVRYVDNGHIITSAGISA